MSRHKRRVPDYTDPESLRFVRAEVKGKTRLRRGRDLGFAIFVISESADSGLVVRIQHAISYRNCCKQGQRYVSYKWVADPVWERHRESVSIAITARPASLPGEADVSDIVFASRSIGAASFGRMALSPADGNGGAADTTQCGPCEIWNAKKQECEKVRTDC
jgi:hypothetical protein